MPVNLKLLPNIRLLNTSLPVAMKPTPPLKATTRVLPIFSRVFPHKLKYQPFRFPNLASQQQSQIIQNLPVTRAMSTRSARERMGSGSASESRFSKSLMDDEAELSDWVGGLSSNSVRKNNVYSDSDADNGGDGRNRDFRGDRNSSRGRGREDRGEKRRRAADFDEFKGSSRRSGGYNSVDSSPNRKGRFDSGRRGGEWDGERTMSRSGNRMSGDNGFGRTKGLNSNDKFSRGSSPRQENERRSDRRGTFGIEHKRGGSSHRQENERRDQKGAFGIERKRGVSMEYGRSGRGEGMKQRTALLSDEDDDVLEEEEDKGYVSFKELIESEEGSEEVDSDNDEEDGDNTFMTGTGFSQSRSEDTSPLSSPGRTESYLTETRFNVFLSFYFLVSHTFIYMDELL